MKKLNKQNLRLFLLFLFSILKLNAFAGNAKLHIATDKENYAVSETIQFQVFLLNPSANINNTLFVELLDCYGNKLTRQMLPFNFNISSGNIALPETGKAEFYILYCYVNNADSMECSSIKKVFINAKEAKKKSGNKIKITHFFEGGTFVAESPNNILISCVDENEDPVIAKGKITDGKTRIYAVFETNKHGLAKIILNPEDKVRYFIEVKDKNNEENISPIPIAVSSGLTLNIATTQSSIIYTLISYSSTEGQIPDYRIEAIHNRETVYDAAITFEKGLSAIKEELKKESLPAGLITFRLLDRFNKIYAQRVMYNSVLPAVNNFITIIDTVNKRETKVILPDMISGKSYINIKPVDTNYNNKNDLKFLQITDEISINDQLIATIELPTGFNALNENTNRFLSLSGTLMGSDKKPLKNKNVTLVILQKNLKKQYLAGKTDTMGKLQINNLIFFDSVTVYYQLSDKSEKKNDVVLDLKVSPTVDYANKKKPPLNFICNDNDIIADSSINNIEADEKILKTVVVTANKEKTNSEKFADKYISGQMKRSNGSRNEIDFIKNPEAIDNRSIWSYLQTSIPGIRIRITSQGTPIISGTFGCTVGVYLNDMELHGGDGLNFLNNLLIRDVAQVKYYSLSFKPKMIGNKAIDDIKACDGGDLLIYTRQDFVASEEKSRGLPKATVVGYHVEKLNPVSNNILDNKSLFWKPEWNVESGQRILIGLPAPELEKDVEIIIEGININLAPYRFTQKLVFN